MSQESQILAYLKTGHVITPMSALREFGCFRLSARIYDLRDAGHDIHCDNLPVGDNKRVGHYTLVKVAK